MIHLSNNLIEIFCQSSNNLWLLQIWDLICLLKLTDFYPYNLLTASKRTRHSKWERIALKRWKSWRMWPIDGWRIANGRRDCLRSLLSCLFCVTLMSSCLFMIRIWKGVFTMHLTQRRTWLPCSMTIVTVNSYLTKTISRLAADLKTSNLLKNQRTMSSKINPLSHSFLTKSLQI